MPEGETAAEERPAEAADDPGAGAGATACRAGDERSVAVGDLTDLLRACLMALRLPPDAGAYQPRQLPFWKVGDAAARITRLLHGLPEGADSGAFLPKIAGGARRALHCPAAVAATFVAAPELTRGGATTLDQDTSWQSIQVRRCACSVRDRGAASKMAQLDA